MIKVLVLCGGQSPEHEISLRSARNVVQALDRNKYEPIIVGIDIEGQWRLQPSIPEGVKITSGKLMSIHPGTQSLIDADGSPIHFDIAFPILHGPNGEDGAIQGLLQILDVPYVSPNILGSSIAMDKEVAKLVLGASGIQVAKGRTLFKLSDFSFEQLKSELGLPLFIKPANMGSSVGVHKVESEHEFGVAVRDAFQFDK